MFRCPGNGYIHFPLGCNAYKKLMCSGTGALQDCHYLTSPSGRRSFCPFTPDYVLLAICKSVEGWESSIDNIVPFLKIGSGNHTLAQSAESTLAFGKSDNSVSFDHLDFVCKTLKLWDDDVENQIAGAGFPLKLL